MNQGRFDQFYLTICKQVGGIQGLLNSFFDFMFRKTDFFYECDPGDKMGFPPGYNTKLLLNTFRKFQQEHYKRFPKKDPKQFEQKVQKYKEARQKKQIKVAEKPANKPNQPIEVKQKVQQPKVQQKQQVKKQNKQIQPIVNTYNGDSNQKYQWSQEAHDVQVTIQIPSGKTSKDMIVELKADRLKIALKGENKVLIEGLFYQKISVANSFWRVENSGKKNFIVLNLQKASERIWSTVLKGDKQIDTSKVDNTKPLSDFDEQTQGALRKIMYEQNRKLQGLPTTEQQKQHQALRKAWDAQGSPFKGTPFDPSKLNLQGANFNA